ncbi:hypothetical protein TorRG33x02_217010 [Trema orientale]|uniref:Uncharacterized protein n=1 Tax=Trema orientale TaxID=63057 RepID=A0A2P5EAA5_TREOI|nr:hypothetical protein TorRG33x02_217010 [Trema orientale]
MNAMTASNQKSQYGYHQVDESNHDLDRHGKREQKANRYGSEIQAHNGASMRPYPGHISSTHTQHNQNSYTDDQAVTGDHGGHYLTDQRYHGPSGMEYGNIGGQPKIHKEHKKGGRMFYKSKVTNMPGTKGSYNRYRNKYNYSDSEYDSSSSDDHDDDESSSDSESDFDCDRRGRRPVVNVPYQFY